MADLDKLIVKIETDLAGLKKGLADAQKHTKKTSGGMRGAFKSIGKDLEQLGATTLKYGSVLAVAFGGVQIKKVIDVGIQIENLQVQLKALFGSAEEGARAFEVMVGFAGRVPFELSQIQRASGNLAVVSDSADELNELLTLTGNIASITGISFEKTAEQLQRSFSSGVASAEIFREKGVRNMLGFQAGVEVSIAETKKRFREVFGAGGEFGNATEEFAQTLTGTLSMLQDKLLIFRIAIGESFNREVKKVLNDVNNDLDKNMEKVKEFGREIGEALGDAVKFVVANIDQFRVALITLGQVIAGAVGIRLITFLTSFKRVLIATAIALAFLVNEQIDAEKRAKELADSIRRLNRELEEQENNQAMLNTLLEIYPDMLNKNKKATQDMIVKDEELIEIIDEVGKHFDEAGQSISDAFGDAVAKGEDFGDSMKRIFQDVVSQIISTIVQIKVITPLLDELNTKLKGIDTTKPKGSGDSAVDGFIGSTIGTAISSLIGFANGGFAGAGKPILVGEKGAEVFVPRTAGNVVPNNSMGGSIIINQSLNFATGVVPTVRSEIMNLMPQIKAETVSAVGEARSRGGTFSRTFGA
tara:strand:- start:686 stop:2446 length:1761 start_codon:yes stop_codon:yes gene_type:complete